MMFNPWVLLGIVLAFLGFGTFTAFEMHKWDLDKAKAALVDEQNKVLATKDREAATTREVEAATEEAKIEVRTVTKTIVKEVPIYVTQHDNAQCSVNVGAVRVLAGAARGMPDFPDPAGRADATASGVELSTLTAAGAEDLGTCREIRETLIGLQNWVAAQATVK